MRSSALPDHDRPRDPHARSPLNLVATSGEPAGRLLVEADPHSGTHRESQGRVFIMGTDHATCELIRGILRVSTLTVVDELPDLAVDLGDLPAVPLDLALVVAPLEDSVPRAIRQLLNSGTVDRVVVLSTPERINGNALVDALAAGADGWLSVDLPADVLIRSLHAARRGEPGISRRHVAELISVLREPTHRDLSVSGGRVAHLTAREHEILLALTTLSSTKAIAKRLSLSEGTVRWYSARLMRKFNVSSRFELSELLVPGRDGQPAASGVVPLPPIRTSPAGKAEGESVEPMPLPAHWTRLSAGERRVVQLVVEGDTNRRVAEKLFISKHTVDSHLKSAFAKLGVRSRVELTLLVHRRTS